MSGETMVSHLYIGTAIGLVKLWCSTFCQSVFSCETKDHIHWVLDSLCQ